MVADKMLGNIYRSIASRAKYGDRYITYMVPAATDTIYDIDAVLEVVRATLQMRNYQVIRRGDMLLIGWGGG